jgi:glycosyltransferase involved in cell wall biosynthesis
LHGLGNELPSIQRIDFNFNEQTANKMNKKRIVILGTAHPLRGGLAAYNERLAEEFQKEGHEVIIYTFSLQYPSFLFPGTSQMSSDGAPEKLNIKVAVNAVNPLNWILIGREIKKLNADMLVIKFWLPFMGPCFGTIARMVKSNNKTKVISILDNVIPHEHRIGDKLFTNYFTKAVDGFIAMSASVKKDLETFTTSKPCLLIPHPIYDNFGPAIDKREARNYLKIPNEEKIVLFFGFIRRYKGLDLLLEAMHTQILINSDVKVVVAGEFYEDRAYYDELIEKYQLKHRLYLATDFIPNDQVKYYFSAADLIVQPYRTATQSGISQMAYHFEKPMVVTNVGGLSEIVPNGIAGLVVNPQEAEIAEAIDTFFTQNLAKEFENGVKEEKKKYLWENITNGVFELNLSAKKSIICIFILNVYWMY